MRQLRAVIRRCVLDSVMPVITPDGLPAEITKGKTGSVPTNNEESEGAGLPQLVKRLLAEKSTEVYAQANEYMEKYVITEVLKSTDGNQSQAAEILGITRGNLRDRISTYSISLTSNVHVG